MSLPDNTESRSEQYLRAIALGDNSGLPPFPQSRTEEYLDYIAKNGGGGGGGSNVVVVNVSYDGDTATFDKTFAELDTLNTNGALILANINIENESSGIYCSMLGKLNYQPESTFPFPAPAAFACDGLATDTQNIYGVSAGITSEENASCSTTTIYPQ